MATTIKLKNGSGAPSASDLVQGEPALDLTNNRLYSENGSGSVVEIGTNPTSLSINGTAITATAAELNILDGVTSTAAELNILDGKAFLDEDDMSSNSATGIASQQSIKAYVDAQITAEDLDFQADSGGALSIDLDSETLTFTGGTGIDTSGSGNAVTFAIDSTVATLSGSQTLTNKSLTAPTITGTAVMASLDISGDVDVDGTLETDALSINGTTVTSTAAELNILDGVTSTAAELNILDGVTSTTAELNILDGVTATTAELNILDGVTATAAELNILDGVTSTTAELNILDGVTSTTAELNILDGVTSTAAELNILDGVTSTTAELNILDGVTATTAELNVLDGVTAFLDEDDFASNSATAIPSQQSVKAYVTANAVSGSGISNVVEDTTPQLGGNLDFNGNTATSFTSTGIDDNATSTAITIDSSENVGIGTTSPSKKLHIVGTDDELVRLAGTSAQLRMYSDSDGFFRLDNVATGKFKISGASTDRLVIDNSGNVGIGEDSPSYKLHIKEVATNPILALQSSTTGTAFIFMGDTADVDAARIAYDNTNNLMYFSVNGNQEAMRIDSSGNVGIGATTINRKLELSGNNNGGAKANYLRITDTDTTATADNQQGGIEFYASDSSAGAGVTASIEVLYAGSGGGGEITFNTAANSGAGVSEAMRVDESGNLLVGKTNTGHVNDGAHLGTSGCFLTAASTAPLTLRRSAAGVVIQLSRGGVNEGTLTMNTGAAPTLASGSDIRLKENVTEHCPELQNILSIKTRQWDWKDKEKGSGEGVVAQELEGIYPDLVFEDNDGMLNVKDFGPMTTRLIKAIQELSTQVNELKAEVAALKGA